MEVSTLTLPKPLSLFFVSCECSAVEASLLANTDLKRFESESLGIDCDWEGVFENVFVFDDDDDDDDDDAAAGFCDDE